MKDATDMEIYIRKTCARCGGSGSVPVPNSLPEYNAVCPVCGGEGMEAVWVDAKTFFQQNLDQ